MLALKDSCVHPETKKPYVKSGIGGKDNSPEGYQVSRLPQYHSTLKQTGQRLTSQASLQNGFTHIFISEFENEEDRAYYLEKDPAHLEFGRSISGLVSKLQVTDFTPGVF